MSERGGRPDVACICIDLGIHVAISVTGEHRDQFLEQFRQEHSGPGHLPEVPARDWYGYEAGFRRYLVRLRAAMAAEMATTEDMPAYTARAHEEIRPRDGML